MQVAILAAGRGTRLGSLAEKRSKAMMPVLGTPVIGWVLQAFLETGIQSFVVVIRPDDRELYDYLENLSQGTANIQIAEQREPRGMGHALGCAARLLEPRFLLTACDSLFSQDSLALFISSWHQRQDLGVLLGLERALSQDFSQRSVVMMDGHKVRRIIEKPALHEIKSDITSLPLYGFSEKILAEISQLHRSTRGEYELQPAIQRLIEKNVRAEGIFLKRLWNLTTTQDLLAMNLKALRETEGKLSKIAFDRKLGVQVHPPVHIEPGVVLGQEVVLGPEVYLEGGCEIGEGANISQVVVLRQTKIPPGSRIVGKVIG
jgi:NDP-sugar pyrophosphorylase family protein